MKCLPLAMLAATTGAAGIADEFVQIPANPSFAFAKSLNPHSSDAERGKGKGSELGGPLYLCNDKCFYPYAASNATCLRSLTRQLCSSSSLPDL